jgi:hypothetical protein
MLIVLGLVRHLEPADRHLEQPNEAPTVVTQGHG